MTAPLGIYIWLVFHLIITSMSRKLEILQACKLQSISLAAVRQSYNIANHLQTLKIKPLGNINEPA